MEPDTPNFDGLAHIYRWMEYFSFGHMLERCRFHFLQRCPDARHALVLGDGDGRFTARLLGANPTVQVDTVDASAAMLAVLQERARHCRLDVDGRLRMVQADLRRFTPTDKKYDVVVSHFFLDCLTEDDIAALVERLLPYLTQDAIWLVSDFSIPEKGLPRVASQMLILALYLAFAIMTGLRIHRIPDHAKVFHACGFRRGENAAYLGGMLITELWQRPSI